MKRLTLLVLALFLSALFPLASHAQSSLNGLIDGDDAPSADDSVPPQRIGVPSTQFNLSSNQSGSVGGFCFDEFLIAPRRVTSFANVLAGDNDAVVHLADGKTVTLQEAINKGAITVRAMQLNLTFTNRTDAPLQVEMRHPVVLWDRPGGDVNPLALQVLESPNKDYDWRQKNVWRITTSERFLADDGYYDGSIWNIDRNRFRDGLKRFQRDNGLEATGELDTATMSRMYHNIIALQERLAKLGFHDRDGRSLWADPAAQIRSYQAYLGTGKSGQWSPKLEENLNGNEEIIKQVAALQNDPRSADETLRDAAPYPNVVTYFNGPKGFMALVQAPAGVELWSRRGTGYTFEGRDQKAVAALDDAAAQLARRASNAQHVVIYPRMGGAGDVHVAIGSRMATLDAKSADNYIDGGEIPAELASAVAPYVNAGAPEITGDRTPTNVVVYRGPLSQGRLADSKSGAALRAKLGVKPLDGARLASALDRTYGTTMPLFVSADLRTGATRLNGATSQGKL